MCPSNYPPGVTGHEDYFTGRIASGWADIEVTIRVKVTVEAEDGADLYEEEACERAIDLALTMVGDIDPRLEINTEFV